MAFLKGNKFGGSNKLPPGERRRRKNAYAKEYVKQNREMIRRKRKEKYKADKLKMFREIIRGK